MVMAVEPMLSRGAPHVRLSRDGWSVFSLDGARAAHAEVTVAVTDDGPARADAVGRSLVTAGASTAGDRSGVVGWYCDQSARGPFDVRRDMSGIVPTLCALRRSTCVRLSGW